MSEGLSWYITIVVVANILACAWLIWWSGKGATAEVEKGATMHHTWDGDLQEFNNPLPRWWLWLFYITIAFGLVYLALYPGLGKIPGVLGWSQQEQYDEEIAAADAKYGPIFKKYASQDLAVLMQDPEGRKIGQRIFLNYCAVCHGSDAGGARGFPNLTDADSLYGNAPATIEKTILDGRQGAMPAWGPTLGDEGVEDVTAYVMSLSGKQVDAAKAEAGKAKFATLCVGCHMPDGTGNKAIGAPNLTDGVWLYGGTKAAIETSIRDGRNGKMPAHRQFLGEDKVRLVAAYVAGLSAGK